MSAEVCAVLEHLTFLARYFQQDHLRHLAQVILMELGFQPNHDGCTYLLQGILLTVCQPEKVRFMGLYGAIAARYGGCITEKQIERAIRTAINAAWENFHRDDWILYFSPVWDGKIKKPCNTAFVSQIARVLQLWKGCCPEKTEDYKEDMV